MLNVMKDMLTSDGRILATMNSPSLTFEEAVRSAGLNFTTLAQMMGRSEPIEGTQGHYIINKVVKTILSFYPMALVY